MSRPPYVSVPDDLAERCFDAGLGADHVGLLTALWCLSSRYQLDGRVAHDRVRSMRGSGPRRVADLAAAGFLERDGGDWIIVEYLTFNRSREEVADLRRKRADAGRDGGREAVAKASRHPSGRFAPSVDDQATDQALARPVTVTVNDSVTVTTSNPFDEWGKPWSAFGSAWLARGFRYLPSEAQREKLWPIVDARPTDVARWVEMAPAGSKAHEVVAYVFRRWRQLEREVAS